MRIRRRRRPTKGNILTRALRGLLYDAQMLAYDALEGISLQLAARSTYGPLSPHRASSAVPVRDEELPPPPPGHVVQEAQGGLCHACPRPATTEFVNRGTGEVVGWCDDCVGTFANAAKSSEWRARAARTMRSSRPPNRGL